MVNAHIIPRSFFELVRGKGKHSVGIVIDKDTYSTPFLQAGPSDESILGNCCEPKFSEWDDYGFKILGKKWDTKDAISSSDGTTPMAFELNAVDYDKLSLFVLSVLWRASISSHRFFKNVSLGPEFEERVRQLLLSRNPPGPAEFSIVFCATPDHKYRATILRPDQIRTPEGIKFYRIYLPYIFILIRADSRAAPFPLNLIMLRRTAWNYIFCFPYGQSPWRALEKTPGELRKRRWVGKGKRE